MKNLFPATYPINSWQIRQAVGRPSPCSWGGATASLAGGSSAVPGPVKVRCTATTIFMSLVVNETQKGGYKELSSILADQ